MSQKRILLPLWHHLRQQGKEKPFLLYVGEFTKKNEMESDLLCNFAGMSVCSSTGMGFTVVPEHESEVWRKGIPVLKPDAEFFTTNHKKTRPSGWSELAELALQ